MVVKAKPTPLVRAKGVAEVRLLLRRPRYVVHNIPIEVAGVPFAVTYACIAIRMVLLLLGGHWDALTAWRLAACGVLTLHILLRLFIYWNVTLASRVQFRSRVSLDQASDVLVLPMEFSGLPEIVPLQHRVLDDEAEVGFEYRKQRFCWDAAAGVFKTLRFPDHETFDTYRKASGLGSQNKVATALQRWGPNQFDVPLPPFTSLLKEHLLAPFFCFQTFCVALWALDDYWYYSVFTLGMLVMFECTLVAQRLRNLKELRSLTTPKQSIQVYRQGQWDLLPGDALLPGDVISIGRPHGEGHSEQVVPADVLLLAGTAIVEEAVLTGESTPQWKNPLGTPSDEAAEELTLAGSDRLSVQRDKAHILFGGTRILQHTGDKVARIRTPDGGCLAVVMRTGFDTSQGQLMRTILHSTERVSANNWETGLFILFLLVFALAASAYVLYHGLQEEGRSRFKLFLNCSMIITSVIPPELPMELSIAINASLLALARKRVFCTEPFRIVMAGKVEVCCFDKTGTLTSNDMLLEGIAGLEGHGTELLSNIKESAPAEVQHVLAGCHSLVYVDGELVGDPLELAGFNSTGWKHADGAFSSPGSHRQTLTIEHRYYFSSMLKRMAAIVRLESADSSAASFWVVAKGAPEVMEQFLADVPADYEALYKQHAAQGSRVIVMAYKQLSAEAGPAELRHMPRAEAESGLTFAGFAVFACPLKPESEPALRELAESSHQLAMITGDTPLTACFAAGRLHIVDRPVLIASHKGHAVRRKHGAEEEVEPDSHFEWVSPDELVRQPFSRERAAVLALASEFDLCVGGEALHHIQQIGAAALFVPLTQVFARTSPEQKELILKTLRAGGQTTLMCGDGTNDVGALKAAHVGVALLAPSQAAKQLAANGPPVGGRGRGAGGRGGGRAGPSGRGAGAAGPQAVVPASQGGRGGAGAGGRGSAGPPKKPGAGTKMLDNMRKKGQPITPKLQEMADWLDSLEAGAAGADGEVPMVKPGDASMAAPFTAKDTAIGPVTDIIKQGRCTLVTTVQMFKILGLLCLSTAYSLSVMYLEGVKLGDLQATLMGVLSAAMFFVLSNTKPLERLSAQRPHPNIFCAYVFLSLLGQFLVHLAFLATMYHVAMSGMSAEDRQAPDAEFKPNLVNTVCFLVNWIIQITTFAVNYIGHPFNTALVDNKGLAGCVRCGWLLLLALVLDFPSGLSSWFSLVPMPSRLAWAVVLGAIADGALAAGWEHFLRFIFPAPRPPAKGYLRFLPPAERRHAEQGLYSAARGGLSRLKAE